MWKPKVRRAADGCWYVVGVAEHFETWGKAYAKARQAAVRFAGREVPC